MQPKSPARTLLFFTLLGTVFAGGCRPKPLPEQPPPPYEGVSLRVACPREASAPVRAGTKHGTESTVAAIVHSASRAWAARQGAPVETVLYDRADGPEKVEADVWVVRPAEMPRWAAAGRLAPVPAALTAREGAFGPSSDLLPIYRDPLLYWDRKAYALPLLGEAPICCWRGDLLEDRDNQEAFQKKYGRKLGPPASWEEFADIAEFFNGRPRKGQPEGAPSLPPLPESDDELDRTFFALAAPLARQALLKEEGAEDRLEEIFSSQYDAKTGKARIGTPGFVEALRLLQRLQKCRPAEASADPDEAFRSGRAVLCLTEASALAGFQKSAAVRDRFEVGPPPGSLRSFRHAAGQWQEYHEVNRVPYLGASGWLAVVPVAPAGGRTEQVEAAFALVADLGGRETSGQIVIDPRWGGGATREDHLERARWDSFDLDARRTAALREALRQTLQHRGLRNPVYRLRTPDEASHRAALLAAVRAALKDPNADPSAALAAVDKQWAELDQARGEATHLAEYRISLGLLPR
jgi:multiple sugar transport system substrate-binding protein